MKRLIGIFSLIVALTLIVPVYGQSGSQSKTDKLTKQQLLSLVATAKTPADHLRLARYYEAQAKYYLAQSKQHEDMAAAYKKNPLFSSSKYATGTVDHCDYFAQSFKEDATKMQELANMHEQMAKDAEAKP
jgi:hypothetical protein